MDVWAIYQHLRDNNAFNFTVLVEVFPPPLFWPSSENKIRPEVIHADTLTGVIDETVVENIHQTYQQAKENNADIPLLEFANNLFPQDISQVIAANSRYSRDQQKIEQQKQLQIQEQIRLELQQKKIEQQQQQLQQLQQQQLQLQQQQQQIQLQQQQIQQQIQQQQLQQQLQQQQLQQQLQQQQLHQQQLQQQQLQQQQIQQQQLQQFL